MLEASAGTGKTLHDRRPGRPLPRRGPGRAGPADAGHLRPDGHQRASAAGARPAGQPGDRAWPRPSRPEPPSRGDALAALLTDVPPTSWPQRRRPGRPGPGRLRRGHHRHHPRVLPADARRAGRARRPRAAGHLRRAPVRPDPRGGHRPLPAPVRDQRPGRRVATPEALTRRRRRRPGGARPAGAGTESIRTRSADRRPSGWRSPTPSAPRSTGASAPAGCSPTTTC